MTQLQCQSWVKSRQWARIKGFLAKYGQIGTAIAMLLALATLALRLARAANGDNGVASELGA